MTLSRKRGADPASPNAYTLRWRVAGSSLVAIDSLSTGIQDIGSDPYAVGVSADEAEGAISKTKTQGHSDSQK